MLSEPSPAEMEQTAVHDPAAAFAAENLGAEGSIASTSRLESEGRGRPTTAFGA